MNNEQSKKVNLRRVSKDRVMKCSKCDEINDFVIMQNGDVECSYCSDVKGNITPKNGTK
jgi:hypothetical protein